MIFTIGHSNLDFEGFLDLLKTHDIQVLIDVRSSPFCKYATWFNKEPLSIKIQDEGFGYLYLGKALGGLPKEKAYLKVNRKPDYETIGKSSNFKKAISELISLASERKVAIMCAEKDPLSCHRHHLLTKALLDEGVKVGHILQDGSLYEPSPSDFKPEPEQLSLF